MFFSSLAMRLFQFYASAYFTQIKLDDFLLDAEVLTAQLNLVAITLIIVNERNRSLHRSLRNERRTTSGDVHIIYVSIPLLIPAANRVRLK